MLYGVFFPGFESKKVNTWPAHTQQPNVYLEPKQLRIQEGEALQHRVAAAVATILAAAVVFDLWYDPSGDGSISACRVEADDAKIAGLNTMYYLDRDADRRKFDKDNPDTQVRPPARAHLLRRVFRGRAPSKRLGVLGGGHGLSRSSRLVLRRTWATLTILQTSSRSIRSR